MRAVENGLNRARRCAVALCAAMLAFSLGGCTASAGSAGAASAGASSRVISADEGRDLMANSQDYLLIDVREQYEYAQGHIEGAICIPYAQLEENRDKLPTDAQSTVIVYCRSGNRSATAAKTLVSMGYAHVLDMGGIINWPYEVIVDDAAQEQPASAGVTADHEHQFEPLDCNYQKCTVCGYEEKY